MRGDRLGREREPFVHRAAFIGLDVTESDPAQPLRVDDFGNRGGHRREQWSLAGVKEQGLIGIDEKLVESESDRFGDSRDQG